MPPGELGFSNRLKRVFVFSASALPAPGDGGVAGREKVQVQVGTTLQWKG